MKTTNSNQDITTSLAITLKDSRKLFEEAEKMIKQSIDAIIKSNEFLEKNNR